MARYLGLDWASNGWVAAALDADGHLSVGFYPTIWSCWHESNETPEQMLVDIPIGLPEDGRRACDERAKAVLGDRRSSVFWTPVRDAVYEDRIETAKDVQEAATGYRISNQAWAIVPRIREVDAFLRETEAARGLVRESHPELCFRKLNCDREPVGAKTDDDGIERRKRLLCGELDLELDALEETVRSLTEPSYAPRAGTDDVLDAMVLAATAKRAADGDCATLPETPPDDEAGLAMEIVSPQR